ncbi:MAG: allantoinase PuuE [Hyphomicrobiales bacterium]|nr:allantoinase PuuE [Hyphomicrobiales bacterium]
MTQYPRDFRGHGPRGMDPKWPNDAKIAVQFVINYEEGGENCILHGDGASEAFLSEIVGAQPWPGQRHWNMETIYEYGARAGFWRLHRLFTSLNITPTVYGVATALARAPEQLSAMQEAGWEIASHGYKWIEYKDYLPEDEMADISRAIDIHTQVTGSRPTGWYTGRCSVNTVDLVASEGGFAYCSDTYADDLPFWHESEGNDPLLMIPYTLDTNDMRFSIPAGFNCGDPFYTYLRDSFDVLYEEGKEGAAKMLNIGLHCRLVGRPGRLAALRRFMEYIQSHDDVWIPTRIEIADHWRKNHPFKAQERPYRMTKERFLEQYGGVFEHSQWIAERAYNKELSPAHNSASGLHAALSAVFRKADDEQRLGVLNAHPDLAGKLAAAKQLTQESTDEQASAGLDQLSDSERANFTGLNKAYVDKFGFPFIIAVKGLSKSDIVSAFEQRINHSQDEELTTACRQVERIALLRLKDLLPE